MVKISAGPDTARQVCVDAFEAMSDDEQTFLRTVAENIVDEYGFGRNVAQYYEDQLLDSEEQLAIWSLLPSYVRSAIKNGR